MLSRAKSSSPVSPSYMEHTYEEKIRESIQHKVDQVILTRWDKKVLFGFFIYKAYNAIGGDKLTRLLYLSELINN